MQPTPDVFSHFQILHLLTVLFPSSNTLVNMTS